MRSEAPVAVASHSANEAQSHGPIDLVAADQHDLAGALSGETVRRADYFSTVTVNWVGVLLVALGIGLAVAEAFATSYGLLTAAGLLSFVLGSLMLIDSPIPGMRIGLSLVLPIAIVVGAFGIFLGLRAWRASGAAVKTGLEALIGETGELTRAIVPGAEEGVAFVHGEHWHATADGPLPAGARVRVEEVRGLSLHVAPATNTSAQGEAHGRVHRVEH